MKDSQFSGEPSKIPRQLNRRLPRWLGMIFGVLFSIIGMIFLLLMMSCLVGGGGLYAISLSRYLFQAACFGVPGIFILMMGIRFLDQTPSR